MPNTRDSRVGRARLRTKPAPEPQRHVLGQVDRHAIEQTADPAEEEPDRIEHGTFPSWIERREKEPGHHERCPYDNSAEHDATPIPSKDKRNRHNGSDEEAKGVSYLGCREFFDGHRTHSRGVMPEALWISN